MSKFKVGDKVKVIRSSVYKLIGKTAIVKAVHHGEVIVEFDFKFTEGETCGGCCQDGKGRTFEDSKLMLLTNRPKLKYEDLIL